MVGDSSDYTLLTYTHSTGVTQGTTYVFRLRAENAQGFSAYSSTLSVLAADIADQVTGVTVSEQTDTTTFTISWTAPDNNGASISAYNVYVRQSDGTTYSTETNECDGSDSSIVSATSCTIEMATLFASPFSLSVGDQIFAKVEAINSYGTGPLSAASSDTVYLSKAPSAPSASPAITTQTETAIAVSYAALSGNSETGGSDILSYNIVFDDGSNGSTFTTLAGETPFTTSLAYTKSGLTSGTTYQFKYRAYNKHGWSDYSPVISILAAEVPDTMDAITFAIQDSVKVRFTWAAPDANGASITRYTILIRQSDDSTFTEDTTNCDGSDSTIMSNLYCDVPFTALIASPYSLAQDDLIVAKIMATNSQGDSTYSAENTSGVTI